MFLEFQAHILFNPIRICLILLMLMECFIWSSLIIPQLGCFAVSWDQNRELNFSNPCTLSHWLWSRRRRGQVAGSGRKSKLGTDIDSTQCGPSQIGPIWTQSYATCRKWKKVKTRNAHRLHPVHMQPNYTYLDQCHATWLIEGNLWLNLTGPVQLDPTEAYSTPIQVKNGF